MTDYRGNQVGTTLPIDLLGWEFRAGGGYPDESDVLDGVVYGDEAQYTGELLTGGYPDEADVLEDVVYGPSGEYVGLLSPGEPIPLWGQLWPRWAPEP